MTRFPARAFAFATTLLAALAPASLPARAQSPHPEHPAAQATAAQATGAQATGAQATGAQATGAQAMSSPAAATRAPDRARLPADRVTTHTLDLAGRRLRFSATAGSITLFDASNGAPMMQLAYVAYAREDAGAAGRPLVFALNGGPGSASAWLHLGGLGPWRLSMEGAAVAPSAPPLLLPNDETWLDFADLVFIDPVGTGYSRLILDNDETRRRVFSVDGDIDVLSTFVRRYVEQTGRAASAKYIVGESYAGLRAPLMARRLQEREAIGLDGLILVSPALDLARPPATASAIGAAALLPTMTAVALGRRGGFDAEAIAAAEAYASGDYVVDLMKGPRDEAAQARIARRVAAFTGLSESFVRRSGGRISGRAFRRAIGRADGRLPSAYDATVTIADPFPARERESGLDAFTDGLAAPLTQAMLELLRARLGWTPEGRWRLSNGEVNRAWNWGGGRGGPEAASALSGALALDARLRVLIAHGYHDLVTPYYESKLLIQLLPDFGDRLSLAVYQGGHMFYAREAARRALREAAARMMGRVAQP